MGHHYIPRFYLRGFTTENVIWVHDRLTDRSFFSQPKTIANENDLYTPELEQHLANSIEAPANVAIDKIRAKDVLNESERVAIARYVVTLWKRVPESRARVVARMPELAASVRDELHAQLSSAAEDSPHLADVAKVRKTEVDQVLKRFEKEVPPEIWQESLHRHPSENVVESLLSMNWRFLYSENHQFLTCDNPVFFFEHEGIGKPTSEVTVPFSSSIVLWANRRIPPTETHLLALPSAVREINRRTAANATRFVYSARQEHWILPFVRKRYYALNRLV